MNPYYTWVRQVRLFLLGFDDPQSLFALCGYVYPHILQSNDPASLIGLLQLVLVP